MLKTLLTAVAGWLVHAVMGHMGGRPATFHIGWTFLGGSLVTPLWWLYRARRTEKEDEDDGRISN